MRKTSTGRVKGKREEPTQDQARLLMHQISYEHLAHFRPPGPTFYCGCASGNLMMIRPSNDVLESLRVTLQKLEHGLDPILDAAAMAELKRMVLLRIAELEAVDAPPACGRRNRRLLWFTAAPGRD
jgi:hypothetical protein